jgi:membrane protein involved in colicin uptake
MVKQQLAIEQRKKVERLEQQHQEARLQLAEEQKKKAERERAAAASAQAQREQEQIEKQKEIEERARLLQIAENPSTEQHQIEIISDSMQDDSDM